ncbi:rod shape-determining protein MreC [Roseivirga sp. BDSF3-8]|uniref:rod shape-determining protein MreC n=1 Tax=Roseivirga sp. BDSF3-8 TaxID=3241598 RepID=UPI0035322954
MRSLLKVIYRYRAFFIFILLELVCTYLIVRNNNYQGAAFFNSSNALVGNLLETQSGITGYLSLKEANKELAAENARLRAELDVLEDVADTAGNIFRKTVLLEDYQYIPARVINNSTRRYNNYLTLNKGEKDSIKAGMGVIGPGGVVGRVKAVSENFATVISVLHNDMLISSQVRRTGYFGSTSWPGKDASTAELKFIPRSESVMQGDTIITSGYNAVYPGGVLVGIVEEVKLREDASFYDIKLRLSTDFGNLSYVYVVENKMKEERDSIENVAITP